MNRLTRIALSTVGFVLSLLLIASLALLPGSAEAQPFAYITNHGSNSVSVIDTATNTVVATVPVGTRPVGVAVNPAGTRVYVANAGPYNPSCSYPYYGCGFSGNTVSVIDAMTNSVVTTITGVGPGPYGVAVNPAGTRVYVTNWGITGSVPSTVSVINTSTNTVIATVPVGNAPTGATVSPDGTRVYVANHGSGTISVIDATSNSVVETISTAPAFSPLSVAMNPGGTRLYVSHYHDNAVVSVIDTASNSVIGTIPVAGGTIGIAVNPDGTRLYAPHTYYYASDIVSVVDLTTNATVATVPVGGWPHGVAVTPSGTQVYVANATSNSVSVIDAATNQVVATIGVGSYPVALGQFIGPDLTQQCVAPPSGLVSWWPGEGNADDIIDGNDGTLQNGVTFAPGVVGQAFSFDGANDEVRVPYAANLNPTQALTLDAWVNINSLTNAANGGYLGVVSMSEGQRAYILGITGTGWNHLGTAGNVHLEGSGLGSAWRTSAAVITPGQWYHIAGVIEPSTNRFEIYVNGVLQPVVSSQGGPQLASVSNVPLRIGHSDPGWSYHFNGLIDEVELYNRALSAQEIQAIFNAGSAGKCKEPADTTAPTTTASASPGPNANGWNNTNVTVTLTATDEEGGSGVKEIHYSLNGGPGTVVSGSSASVTISAEGITTLTYFAKDNAENQEEPQTLTVRIDKTPPSMMGVGTPGPNASGWNNTDVTVSFTCSDSLSGIDSCGPTPQVVTTEGMGQSRTGTAVDKAGNTASATVSGINIDKTLPVLSNVPGPIVVGQTGLAGTPVTVPMPAATDNFGPVVLTSDAPALFPLGTTTVTFTAKDPAGNTATASTTVTVVETPGRMHGEGHINADGKRYHFEFSARDRANGQEGGRLHFRVREHRPGRDRDDEDEDRWPQRHRFVSTTIAPVIFSDTATIRPGRRPQPTVDTVEFAGSGLWDGRPGYTFTARATDAGEPGRGRDTFAITIKDPRGAVVASVAGTLSGGNIQSLRLHP